MGDFSSNQWNATRLEGELEGLKENIDAVFLLINGIIVSLMQAGFACLEAGCVSSKNVTNILMKNLYDLFICATGYWLVGYSLAYGKGGPYLGMSNWAGVGLSDTSAAHWFFQFVFAATAATIISGAVAERCRYTAYIVYCFVLSSFVYPVASHWAWSEEGLLATLGYRDFAGSGVVHALAGVASFVAALFIGPRAGRFDPHDGRPVDKPGHSTMLTGLGGLLLISGFLAFNGGSLGHMTQPGDGAVIGRTISNTILGGSGSGLVALILARGGVAVQPASFSFSFTLNGILAGMVSVCASADSFSPMGAVLSGAVACLAFWLVRSLVLLAKVDDPLDAVAVHFGGGFWGALSGPIFARGGVVYGADSHSLGQLLNNLLGVLIISGWSVVTSVILFGTLRALGALRVSEEEEAKGLDVALHGEPAYPSSAWGGPQTDNECIKVQEMPTERMTDSSLELPMKKKGTYTLRQTDFENLALDLNSEHRR